MKRISCVLLLICLLLSACGAESAKTVYDTGITYGSRAEPEAAALTGELSALMRTAVDSLPPPDDEIFKRHYFLYQKTADIARALGMNEATVRTKLRRGRGRLREYFTERSYDCEDIYD